MRFPKSIMSLIGWTSPSLIPIGQQRRNYFCSKDFKSISLFIQTRFRKLELNRWVYWKWQDKRRCSITLYICLSWSWWLSSCNFTILSRLKDKCSVEEIQPVDWWSNNSHIKCKRREPPKVPTNKLYQIIINSVNLFLFQKEDH